MLYWVAGAVAIVVVLLVVGLIYWVRPLLALALHPMYSS